MHNYLLVKTAVENRFHISPDFEDFGATKVISALADKAGIPRTSIPTPIGFTDRDGVGGSYNPSTGIISMADTHGRTIDTNKLIVDPTTLLHEYGHLIDHQQGIKGWRGFFDAFVPNSYMFFHPQYEQAADDNALKLIDQIDNPEDRAELKRIYNRSLADNIYYSKLARPREIGQGIGGIVGGVAGAAGGGYLGYKGGDKLFNYLNNRNFFMPKNQHLANPEGVRKFLQLSGAAIGGMGGYVGGDYLGGKAGYSIGNMFIDKNRIKKFNDMESKLVSSYGKKLDQDAIAIFNRLQQSIQ